MLLASFIRGRLCRKRISDRLAQLWPLVDATMAVTIGMSKGLQTLVGDHLKAVHPRLGGGDGLQINQEIVDKRHLTGGAPREGRNRCALGSFVHHQRVWEPVARQPFGPREAALVRRVGQNDDADGAREDRKRLAGPRGGIDVVAGGVEKCLEKRPARGLVDRIGLARTIDILEQGEPGNAHFQTLASDKTLETSHEHREHFIHIDDQ